MIAAAPLAEVISGMPSPDVVRQLESLLGALPQLSLDVKHVVHGGVSARSLFIPAGSILTGAQTNIENLCIVIGDVTATTDAGPQRLTGFNIIPANAGAKRVVVANSDTWWVTVHRTDLTDVSAIEEEMTDEADQLGTRRLLAGSESINMIKES